MGRTAAAVQPRDGAYAFDLHPQSDHAVSAVEQDVFFEVGVAALRPRGRPSGHRGGMPLDDPATFAADHFDGGAKRHSGRAPPAVSRVDDEARHKPRRI